MGARGAPRASCCPRSLCQVDPPLQCLWNTKKKNHPSIQLQVLTHLLSPSLLSIWAAQSAFLHRRSAGTTFLITDVRHASCDGLVGVQLVVCLFQPSHSHNLWLNDLPNLRRKGEIIALTDRDIRCLLCQISPPLLVSGCSQTEVRQQREFSVSGPCSICHLRGGPTVSCACLSLYILLLVSKVTTPPLSSPAHPSLEWMTPGTPEDSHLAVAPLHFSLPLKHNSELPRHSPNKCYSSCIFNLLTDAIILYTPCSLILMQLLLFIAGRFFFFFLPPPPSYYFIWKCLSLSLDVCVRAHLCARHWGL